MRGALQRGEERVFSASLYLCLRAPTAAALDDLTRRVEAGQAGRYLLRRLARHSLSMAESGSR
jgi:hypothetical protein